MRYDCTVHECRVGGTIGDDGMAETKELQSNRLRRLAAQARSGDCDAFAELFLTMMPRLRRHARRYAGGAVEFDDLVQEGALGLMRAVHRYRAESPVPFESYAMVCADRQMISAVRAASRKKSAPAQPPISIDELEAAQPQLGVPGPEAQLLAQEKLRAVFQAANTRLSPMEKRVLAAYLSSVSTRQAAARLGISAKSADNAMQRIRRKLRDSSK